MILMFKVTKKPLTPNIVWDAEKNIALCRFTKGVFETNDKDLADKLQEMGHTVSGEADTPVGDDQANGTPEGDGADDSANQQNTNDADATDDEQVSGEADAAPKPNRRSRK